MAPADDPIDALLYPESSKVLSVQEKSQVYGEFLEWLKEKYVIAECFEDDLYPVRFSIPDLLAQFFGVDQNKLETERRRMLNELRRAHERRNDASDQ